MAKKSSNALMAFLAGAARRRDPRNFIRARQRLEYAEKLSFQLTSIKMLQTYLDDLVAGKELRSRLRRNRRERKLFPRPRKSATAFGRWSMSCSSSFGAEAVNVLLNQETRLTQITLRI